MSVGRPTVLTDEVRRKVIAALRVGASRTAAAVRAGIGASTLHEWMARTGEEEPYASFRVEVEEAEAICELRLSSTVFKAALGDPNQARWLLERRFPGEWGKKTEQKVELSGQVEAKIPAEVAQVAECQAALQFWAIHGKRPHGQVLEELKSGQRDPMAPCGREDCALCTGQAGGPR